MEYDARHREVDQCVAEEGMTPACLALKRDIMFPLRESWATDYLLDFLRSRPEGSSPEVVLAFGGGHTFCDDFFRADYRVDMQSIWIRQRESLRHIATPSPEPCE